MDHRSRVARQRRARTRARIIEAALPVFAARGKDAPVIDDFIRAAGIARGTFYNYYRDTRELFEDASRWLEDDLIESILPEIDERPDPVHRLTLGVRLWMRKAQGDPLWCAFTLRSSDIGSAAEKALGGDMRAGLRSGQFQYTNFDAAYDLVVGTVREGMRRVLAHPRRRGYDAEIARAVLRGLGLPAPAIEKAIAVPVPNMRRPPRQLR